MSYKTVDEIAKDHSNISSCTYKTLSAKKLTSKMKRYH